MTIWLKDVWPIDNAGDFKIHFARYDKGEKTSQPLNVWLNGESHWRKWQEYRPNNDAFNRRYIFSLMRFYHEPSTWLFGGVYEVVGRPVGRYEVELTDVGKCFIGRLKIDYAHTDRVTRPRMERYYACFKVKEILPVPYKGRAFPGFEGIDVSFEELKSYVETGKHDWKSTLENIKGIYLLTDTKTGKRYVGAAHGKNGVWSRWVQYINTCHGENSALKDLVNTEGDQYFRKHFRFALLEHRAFNTPVETILNREKYWKCVLMTDAKKWGYNFN